MKKMLICCGVLCMTLLLFCGTAFAAEKVTIQQTDSSVSVSKDAEEKVFTVTKSGVKDGDLYLVMIQKGDASAKPTADNLYYLNVEKVSGTTLTMNNVYPKDLDNGDYVVYLSDYAGSNGGRKQVATLSVGGPTPDYLCGDVNHSGGKPDNRDVRDLARYVGEWPDYLPNGSHAIDLSLADVNSSGGKPDNRDVRDLARYVGEWTNYPSLPHTN